jgi:hypothetical protein
MDEFYVIKLISHRTGDRGFVSKEAEKGVMISDNFSTYTKQFSTKKEAQNYIREKKLERGGYTAHIWSNNELIESGAIGKKMTEPLYTAINLKGENIFYDEERGYYFEKREAGYCVWKTEQDVQDFILKMNFDYDVLVKKIEPK